MFGSSYYHGAIRKYVIMFGNMFNDIDISRFDSTGAVIQNIRVPIAYGPKEKWLARVRQTPEIDRDIATQLPRLAFEIINFAYAPTRTVNKLNRNKSLAASVSPSYTISQFAPVPYDINVALYGMFATTEDAVQVVEQILPYFKPEWTHSIKIVPSMEQYYDVPTVLNDVSIEDSYEGDFNSGRRLIMYTFTFTIKGYIFGPVQNRGIIKRTLIDFTIPSANTTSGDVITDPSEGPNSRLTITPGLFANGSPTTDSSESVSYTGISADDNYGISVDQDNYFDGITRHNHT